MDDVYFGESKLTTSATECMMDTGSALIYLPDAAVQEYASLMNATLVTDLGLYTIRKSALDTVKDMSFIVGGVSFIFFVYRYCNNSLGV